MTSRSLCQWLSLLLLSCSTVLGTQAQELSVNPIASPEPIEASPASVNGEEEDSTASLLDNLSRTLVKETSVAISPVIGLSYLLLTGDKSVEDLKPGIWVVIVLLGATLLKDVGGTFVPGILKKPLDALDFFQNQGLGAVCAALFVPDLYQSLYAILESMPSQADPNSPILAASAAGSGSNMLELLAMPLSIACFLAVWLLSNCINVLILMSPFSTVDICLKGVKVTALGAIAGLSAVDPLIGAGLSVLIILFAFYLSGKAFRLYWFGMIFAGDLILRRHKRFQPKGGSVRAFLDQEIQDVPSRTYGTLKATDSPNTYQFNYRPWLLFTQRTIDIRYDQPLKLGRGLIHLSIETTESDNDLDTQFHLAPRYNTHEEALAKQLNMTVVDVGIRRGLKYAVTWVKSAMRFNRKSSHVVV